MSIGAAGVALAVAVAFLWVGDPSVVLSAAAELAAVLTLFLLICAAEAWN